MLGYSEKPYNANNYQQKCTDYNQQPIAYNINPVITMLDKIQPQHEKPYH